jgi:hypothetical protein
LRRARPTFARELEEYASRRLISFISKSTELRATSESFEAIVHRLAQRQEFYSARLRQFASQMQATEYPTTAAQLEEVVRSSGRRTFERGREPE